MKPALKTTEFWGRGIVSVVGLLVGAGIVKPQTGQMVQDVSDSAMPIIQTVIDGIIQLASILVAAWLQFQQGKERAALKGIEAKK